MYIMHILPQMKNTKVAKSVFFVTSMLSFYEMSLYPLARGCLVAPLTSTTAIFPKGK